MTPLREKVERIRDELRERSTFEREVDREERITGSLAYLNAADLIDTALEEGEGEERTPGAAEMAQWMSEWAAWREGRTQAARDAGYSGERLEGERLTAYLLDEARLLSEAAERAGDFRTSVIVDELADLSRRAAQALIVAQRLLEHSSVIREELDPIFDTDLATVKAAMLENAVTCPSCNPGDSGCATCGDEGWVPAAPSPACPNCNGHGLIPTQGNPITWRPCPVCSPTDSEGERGAADGDACRTEAVAPSAPRSSGGPSLAPATCPNPHCENGMVYGEHPSGPNSRPSVPCPDPFHSTQPHTTKESTDA